MNFMVPHPAGFVIYTSEKAIAAKYTSNKAYPWRFIEINRSSGAQFVTDVHGGTNTGIQYLISPSGNIQAQDLDTAQIVSSDVSDYLSCNSVYTTFDYINRILTEIPFPLNAILSNGRLKSSLVFLLDRYIVISYVYSQPSGKFKYDYAFVYDILLNRLGKVRKDHTNVVESNGGIFFILGHDITGGSAGGTITRLYTDIKDQVIPTYQMAGVLVLGKFQYARQNFICVEDVSIESVQSGLVIGTTLNHTLFLLPTLDGKTFLTAVLPTITLYSATLVDYNTHTSCHNFAVGLQGAFDVSSIQMNMVREGTM